MELRSILVEYKQATEKFIQDIRNDDTGEEFIEKRESLINILKEMDFDKQELKDISNEINLLEVEKQAFNIVNEEKVKVKEEIITLRRKKEAANGYGQGFGNTNFFNRKV